MCRRIMKNQFNRLTWGVFTIVTLLMYVFVFSAISAENKWGGKKIGVDSTSKIDIDDPKILQANESNPITATSPIKVNWQTEGTMVVQVYRKGVLIYPENDRHEEHGSGVTIPLSPGKHEVKVWVPDTGNSKSTWVMIIE